MKPCEIIARMFNSIGHLPCPVSPCQGYMDQVNLAVQLWSRATEALWSSWYPWGELMKQYWVKSPQSLAGAQGAQAKWLVWSHVEDCSWLSLKCIISCNIFVKKKTCILPLGQPGGYKGQHWQARLCQPIDHPLDHSSNLQYTWWRSGTSDIGFWHRCMCHHS